MTGGGPGRAAGAVLVTGASLVTANLLMDLLALVLNPRLRKGDNW